MKSYSKKRNPIEVLFKFRSLIHIRKSYANPTQIREFLFMSIEFLIFEYAFNIFLHVNKISIGFLLEQDLSRQGIEQSSLFFAFLNRMSIGFLLCEQGFLRDPLGSQIREIILKSYSNNKKPYQIRETLLKSYPEKKSK